MVLLQATWKVQANLVAERCVACRPRLCRLMAHQIALLLPHLGGKAYSLRSAIVHAIGSLLHKAFDR